MAKRKSFRQRVLDRRSCGKDVVQYAVQVRGRADPFLTDDELAAVEALRAQPGVKGALTDAQRERRRERRRLARVRRKARDRERALALAKANAPQTMLHDEVVRCWKDFGAGHPPWGMTLDDDRCWDAAVRRLRHWGKNGDEVAAKAARLWKDTGSITPEDVPPPVQSVADTIGTTGDDLVESLILCGFADAEAARLIVWP